MGKKIGKQTIILEHSPKILAGAAVVGKKEGDGPLAKYFDEIVDDEYAGEKSFEAAESKMLKMAFGKALAKSGKNSEDLSFIISGDLQNQCTAASYAFRESDIPFIGVYGACSTMSESLTIGSMLIDGGSAEYIACVTSSHFCSAEKQFRYPLEFGSQRTPTAQWTVTGAGSVIIGRDGSGPEVTCVTPGKIIDLGIKDANNMGAAMAPAACDTIMTHLKDTGRGAEDYDMILTGDLGSYGSEMLQELCRRNGIDLKGRHRDCGVLIFDLKKQGVDCGGSGCGCSASVLSSYVLECLNRGEMKRVLFIATGALLSPTRNQQGESIPGIAHAVAIEVRPKSEGKA